MSIHVAAPKMRLSKLIFIALVAICLAFMKVHADPADEVAVENEGEAVAPGAQAVEGGAEVGETQAAQDLVRSQMISSRGPTRSQTPSKMQKGNKMKIAIVIGLVLLLLAAVLIPVGVLVIRPKLVRGREKKFLGTIDASLPKGMKWEEKKIGDDKKTHMYLAVDKPLSADAEKTRVDMLKKLEGSDAAKKVEGGIKFACKSEDEMKKVIEAMGCKVPSDKTAGAVVSGFLAQMAAKDHPVLYENGSVIFLNKTSGDDKKKDDDKEKDSGKKGEGSKKD